MNKVRQQTLDFIRNNPERWDQIDFASDPWEVFVYKDNDTLDCGTTFCLAGTAAYLTGFMMEHFVPRQLVEHAKRVLDIDEGAAYTLFYNVGSDPDEGFSDKDFELHHSEFVELLEKLFAIEGTITEDDVYHHLGALQ